MSYIELVDLSTVAALPAAVRSELKGKVVGVHFIESFIILDEPTCWSEEVMHRFSEVQERCYAVSWLSLWRVADEFSLDATVDWLKANSKCQLFYFKKQHCLWHKTPPKRMLA